MLSPSRARSVAGVGGTREKAAGRRRRPPRSGGGIQVRDQILGAAADQAVDAMASWGFVWIRDPCGCDGSGEVWTADIQLEGGGRYVACRCKGQGRLWYPSVRQGTKRITDRQLVELYEKEKARRRDG